ncbi:DNA-binding MarR family transcriptional regulator [Paenibacillus castaneae]|uniref:MarR family winged helix-turn-helix transcriptional regulator n=1 Tax=Paenibacillus castaneae TaxID=474957 RepID=UPI000C9CFE02|nr:MarR family transcriptional regulator [Paenibacillus castaneae]NIK79005.1 DNA-binding MarR family transcriptional regulator [Paenibacillus castaneae]
MEQTDIFKLIHTVELFTNEVIIRWMNSFEHNIGISPILVLSELKHKGPQKQTVLAKHLGYTPGALTNIANRLIKLSLAERKYNEEDRRNVLLSITEKGLDVLKEAQQRGRELRVELFQVLSEEEQQQYLIIHEKLLKNLRNPEV